MSAWDNLKLTPEERLKGLEHRMREFERDLRASNRRIDELENSGTDGAVTDLRRRTTDLKRRVENIDTLIGDILEALL